MSSFRQITKRDDPARLAKTAQRHQALLLEALDVAKRKAANKPELVRKILATGVVEGLASKLNAKAAGITYRAEQYKRTWHTLIPWQHLEHTTAEEQAEYMIQTLEDNIEMTESNSWPEMTP